MSFEFGFSRLRFSLINKKKIFVFQNNFSEIRYDCFIVNLIPFKSTIESQIRRFHESMLAHLKRSITRELTSIDSFINEGFEALNDRPRTHEEISSSYRKHEELNNKRRNIHPLYERLEAKNKLLRSFGAGGHEQLVQLQLKLDKFETMMDSHVQMINEQTDVLKRNLRSRYETFKGECEKLQQRWKQLRPREQDLEDDQRCREALKLVRDKDKEVQEMVQQKEKMM